MIKFIGTKIVKAEPMTRLAYNEYRGWELSKDENGADEGYLVEYQNGGPANVKGHDGYVSWSPKEVFELSYRPTNGISFGLGLEALKKGYCIHRNGWNGKGMFIRYVPTTPELNEHLEIKNVRGTFDTWVPSISDLMADDWQILD